MLADGYHPVPKGKVATVVTQLEMRSRAETRDVPHPEGWILKRIQSPTQDWYRSVFSAVGANWLWFGRMKMEDAELDAILTNPGVHVYTLQKDGTDGALLELDFRTDGECELAYFGLTAPLIGTGAGRFLMNTAIDTAWSADITRFHVHTCTLDSPQALGFYRRSGFVPIRQKIEIADDPRITFGYDRALAPHVPIFDP
ncbi:GNAT family N-acetyltransferase [uncultured Tateyamaria sp.]|uniref:GNAT family N-acetyltransferase n=1 Tax=uncultured Tateyamaria sp. TaxID=455651 RepID=UPI00261224B0|nr:GNAT family N-acetyltransferase [uncultured Tateyamaria sp.]